MPKFVIPPDNGAHRRFFWRVRHRYGGNWWMISERVMRRELRMFSWRRAL